ncbi:MAG: beta-propeller domain-containing protein [Dehalococcoidia bacterium]
MNKGLIAVLALLLLLPLIGSIQQAVDRPGSLEIGRFSSYEELKGFVKANAKDAALLDVPFVSWRASESGVPAPGGSDTFSVPDYSATNVQVAGVDEADIVKTDGKYIYLVSENRVIIVMAYPPEQAQVLSEIELEGMAAGIFINGDRLVVFEGGMPYYSVPGVREDYMMPYMSSRTSVRVYDVSDRENPSLQREFSADGDYVSSRMIGDYAYVVINEPVYEQEGELNLPRIYSGGNETEIPAEDIYYYDVYDYFYMYTSIIAINTQNDDQEPTIETILLGASSNLYVSLDNIYLTFPVWGSAMWDFQKSTIHRIHIDGDSIEYVASGEVPGMVLNQFSMDEYDEHFRVATTTQGQTSMNHVYVLDMELNIVGRLEDLAKGETIYSARFMGERGYVVTFRTIDPLFVIDLKDPRNPTVLGELKITGYSGYLHPYDENHLIGIGKETTEEGEFAWYQGVKISLFDVSDVNKPEEIDKEIIGHRGTDSPVLWDHKAFLFDKSRNLMVIPVSLAQIDEAEYPEGVPSWAWGRMVWQGAYVFNVTAEAGLRLEDRISHIDELPDPEENYYDWYSFSVKRSLYIGDVLYTISDAMIKMNRLENLDYINEVELPYTTWEPIDYLPDEPWDDEPRDGEPSVDDKSEGEQLSKS